jgi:hypothetical protein
MEQQFFEDEFEQFLRENADQHRMYPSDGVWTNIYRNLHSGRRRIALGAMLMLVLSGIIWLANLSPVAVTKSKTSIQTIDDQQIAGISKKSTVTVDDIIEKLRAKSLIPPMSIAAPLALSPLQLQKPAHLSDTYKVSDTPGTFGTQDGMVFTSASSSAEVSRVIVNKSNDNEEADLAPKLALPVEKNITQEAVVEAPHQNMTPAILSADIPNAGYSPTVKVNPVIPRAKNKLSYIMSFAPSIGYRNLFDGKNHITYGNSPLMVRHLNVNQFVDHQPSIGFELGGGIRYQVSRVLAIRTGLQFNLTRYSIEAFSHSPEKTTLSLNPAYGYQRETLVATSNVRNIVGNDPERLQNQYLQLALPIAAELKLFGDSKLQVNIAGSIQPVYLLNTNQYLLSNDFSNYVKEPSLVRRWNMATSMEAFVSYNTGGIRWQVGPQFRYNLMSSFKKQYAIRENLMEYGVKIGVSKTIR